MKHLLCIAIPSYLAAIDFTATLQRDLATALPASEDGVVGMLSRCSRCC